MASSRSRHSQLSTDTISSMSGSYIAGGADGEAPETPVESRGPSQEGEETPVETQETNFVAIDDEEQDSEGNDVTEEECPSPTQEEGN
ncbi:UNVERIFIED_CONTAM: hypothetical protein FKN15_053293 [Acipenser sinensis]